MNSSRLTCKVVFFYLPMAPTLDSMILRSRGSSAIGCLGQGFHTKSKRVHISQREVREDILKIQWFTLQFLKISQQLVKRNVFLEDLLQAENSQYDSSKWLPLISESEKKKKKDKKRVLLVKVLKMGWH